MRHVAALALLLVVGCGKKSEDAAMEGSPVDDEPATESAPEVSAPAPVDAALPKEITPAILKSFMRDSLCGMALDKSNVHEVGGVVAARFVAEGEAMSFNISHLDAETLKSGRALYGSSRYERKISGSWGVFHSKFDIEGKNNHQVSIILRDAIDVTLGMEASSGAARDPTPCLLELDLQGLVDLAARAGVPSGMGDLDFDYTEQQWAEHKEQTRPRMGQLVRRCETDKDKSACDQVSSIRDDCAKQLFDQRLAETDFHFTAKERANFKRTWDLNCELLAAKK